MACDCIDLTNEVLRPDNLILDCARWFSQGTGETMTTVRIGTEKIKPKRGQTCPSFVPKFCPFCGTRYRPEDDV